MTRLLALVIFALVIVASLAAGEEAPLSLAEYKSRLEQYRSEIKIIAQHPEHAVDFNHSVPPTFFQVQTQAGVITVSVEFLHKELDEYLEAASAQKATILSQLAERIKAMRNEADSFEHARGGDPAARERLNQILSASEFDRVHGPSELELLQERISTWIQEKLNKLFPDAPDLDQWGQIFVWIVIAIASSILAVWLYRQSKERMDRPREVMPFVPSAKSWRTWLIEAHEKAGQGEWREAIRLGFWAAVSRLESDGIWRPDKTRTPREYLNAIPVANGIRPPFAAVTKIFEAAWYGGRPASAGDFERFVMEIEKLGCRG
jgi:hypothetical protein